MQIELNGWTFTWVEHWARIPDTSSSRKNGRTHGVAVTRDGRVVVFHQSAPAVSFYADDGTLLESWGDRFPGAHGLTLVEEDGEERLWLTDETTGEVVKTTLFGQTLLTLTQPDHPAYADGAYSPTWIAVDEERFGGSGTIWLADGYGSSLVHRYDRDGKYVSTLTGEEGAGRFNCPHAATMRYADGRRELMIADRGNRRFQVFDEEGSFVRAFGDGLHLPCMCFDYDGTLAVPELNARLAFVEHDGSLRGYVGRNEDVCSRSDWPNVPEGEVKPGRFNSPHSAAADDAGNIYVVEWILGGRITKLART